MSLCVFVCVCMCVCVREREREREAGEERKGDGIEGVFSWQSYQSYLEVIQLRVFVARVLLLQSKMDRLDDVVLRRTQNKRRVNLE